MKVRRLEEKLLETRMLYTTSLGDFEIVRELETVRMYPPVLLHDRSRLLLIVTKTMRVWF